MVTGDAGGAPSSSLLALYLRYCCFGAAANNDRAAEMPPCAGVQVTARSRAEWRAELSLPVAVDLQHALCAQQPVRVENAFHVSHNGCRPALPPCCFRHTHITP